MLLAYRQGAPASFAFRRDQLVSYPTAANVQASGLACLGYLPHLDLPGVLNDNRRLVGCWDSSLDWLPRGLRYFACLRNPGVMAVGSAAAMQQQLGEKLNTSICTDYNEAEKWLRSMATKHVWEQ